jgi:hypothetical protein
MFEDLKEVEKTEKIFDDLQLILKSYYGDVGLFVDLYDNWFLGFIDGNFYPKKLYDGDMLQVQQVFHRYIAENEMDLEMLNECR